MAEPERSTASSLSLHIVPDQAEAEADGEIESKGSEARTTFERCVLEDFEVVLASEQHSSPEASVFLNQTITEPSSKLTGTGEEEGEE